MSSGLSCFKIAAQTYIIKLTQTNTGADFYIIFFPQTTQRTILKEFALEGVTGGPGDFHINKRAEKRLTAPKNHRLVGAGSS